MHQTFQTCWYSCNPTVGLIDQSDKKVGFEQPLPDISSKVQSAMMAMPVSIPDAGPAETFQELLCGAKLCYAMCHATATRSNRPRFRSFSAMARTVAAHTDDMAEPEMGPNEPDPGLKDPVHFQVQVCCCLGLFMVNYLLFCYSYVI